jgi:hypothetical protein
MAISAERLRALRCTSYDYRQEHGIEGGCATAAVAGEDSCSQPRSQPGADEVAESSGEDGEEAGLGVEEQGNGSFAGPERAHEADLAAAFEHSRSHGGADGESGR